MGEVDYYLVRVHPFGGFAAVPVAAGHATEPPVTADDWRFPTVELAVQWADDQQAPGGIAFHEDCGPIGDFGIIPEPDHSYAGTRLRTSTDPDTMDKVFALAEGDDHAWGEEGPAYTELGQALFSNAYTHSHTADWATSGIGFLAETIAKTRGEDYFLDANYGADPYENDTFVMRSYCWCDGGIPDHADFCPPNFVYKPTGLTISWYKHAGRGITADRSQPDNWSEIILDCLQSVTLQGANR